MKYIMEAVGVGAQAPKPPLKNMNERCEFSLMHP